MHNSYVNHIAKLIMANLTGYAVVSGSGIILAIADNKLIEIVNAAETSN